MEKLFGIEMNHLAISLASLMVIISLSTLLLALRNRVLLKMALRNIPRRKSQTILIIVGLMLSTTIIMSALSIGDSINSAIRIGAFRALGETDIRLSSPVFSRFGDDYLDDAVLDRVERELKNDPRVDGILPLLRKKLPILNESNEKTISEVVIVGLKLDSLDGFTNNIFTPEYEKSKFEITDLDDNETIINKSLSDKLDLKIGDELTIVSPIGRTNHIVVEIVEAIGLAGGEESTPSSALIPITTAQKLFQRGSEYNLIEISIAGDVVYDLYSLDEKSSKEVSEKLQLIFTNQKASEEIYKLINSPEVIKKLNDELLSRESNSDSSTYIKLSQLIDSLNIGYVTDDFKISITDTFIISIVLEVLNEDLKNSLYIQLSELEELEVQDIKNSAIEFAETIASGIVIFFTIFGSFSIIVGLLLIFLIFVMLASSRTTEMGIARAIGTKRRHLIQMFTYEGLVYSFGASIVGTILGLLSSVILMQLMIRAFSETDEVVFYFSVTLQSIIIAFSAGFVLTALTVFLSAYRVSKLNIVVAIRGLSEEFVSEENLSTKKRALILFKWLFGPITFAYDTWKIWRSGQGVFIRIFQLISLFFVLPWIIIIFWKIFKFFQPWFISGWPLLPVGALFIILGLDPEKGIDGLAYDSAAIVTLGVIITTLSIGFSVRAILRLKGFREELQKRISMTLIGIILLIFFSLPFDALDNLTGELEGGPEMFILSGVSLVAASVWIIMHNAEIIVWLVSKIIEPWKNLKPVVKMAIAYPMAARLRTGLTLAMFSLVIFTMMIFAILINLTNSIQENPDIASGGFDIRGTIRPELPISDPKMILDSNQSEISSSDFSVIAAQASLRIEARQKDTEEKKIFKNARLVGSDDEWLNNNNYELTHWDPKYGSNSKEIWQSLVSNSNLAVISAELIWEEDGFGPPRDTDSLQIKGIDPEEKGEIKAVNLDLRPPLGQGEMDRLEEVIIIGVLDQFADNYENSRNNIYMNYSIIEKISSKPVPFTVYKFKLSNDTSGSEITRILETLFINNGMKAKYIMDEIDQEQSQSNAFNQLFQGFMGLGLLVGVASLGVISFRAVVERRQSIGMMRAIGFKERMIQIQFLMESAIVSIIGSLLGIALGSLIAWNIYDTIGSEGVTFSIPWINVIIVISIAFFFSLVTTFLPSKQASKISPAEALRY